MRGEGAGVLMWGASAIVAAAGAFVAVVMGEWFAAVGWAVGAAGSVGAAGQTARLVQIHRDLEAPAYGRHVWWDDGGGESPDYGPDEPPSSDLP